MTPNTLTVKTCWVWIDVFFGGGGKLQDIDLSLSSSHQWTQFFFFSGEFKIKVPPCCQRADCSWTPESSPHQAQIMWAAVGLCLCQRAGLDRFLSTAEHLTETFGPRPAACQRMKALHHRATWSTELSEIQPSQLTTQADSAGVCLNKAWQA